MQKLQITNEEDNANALWSYINKDWNLHRRKHELYGNLAKQKAIGGPFVERNMDNKMLSFAARASYEFTRDQKIPYSAKAASILFPQSTLKIVASYLKWEFKKYWREGRLDQFIPKKNWDKRQEKENSWFFKELMKADKKSKAKTKKPKPKKR